MAIIAKYVTPKFSLPRIIIYLDLLHSLLTCSAFSTLLFTLPSISTTITAATAKKGPYNKFNIIFWSLVTIASSKAHASHKQRLVTTAICVMTTIVPNSFLMPSTVSYHHKGSDFFQIESTTETEDEVVRRNTSPIAIHWVLRA
jgi:hypothetical protein